jgi:hypothetical protein
MMSGALSGQRSRTILAPNTSAAMPHLDTGERSRILARLERLHTLLDLLERKTSDPTRLRRVRQLMRRELMAAKKAVKRLMSRDRAR